MPCDRRCTLRRHLLVRLGILVGLGRLPIGAPLLAQVPAQAPAQVPVPAPGAALAPAAASRDQLAAGLLRLEYALRDRPPAAPPCSP